MNSLRVYEFKCDYLIEILALSIASLIFLSSLELIGPAALSIGFAVWLWASYALYNQRQNVLANMLEFNNERYIAVRMKNDCYAFLDKSSFGNNGNDLKTPLEIALKKILPRSKFPNQLRAELDLHVRNIFASSLENESVSNSEKAAWFTYKKTYGNTHEEFLAKLEAGAFDDKRESK